MMFFKLDEGDVTLSDIKRIAQGLIDNKWVFKHLTPEQYADLAYILTPTMAADRNEANIRERWAHVLTNFTINDAQGRPMRFYLDDKIGRIYFGDAEGWKEAQAFVHNELNPDNLKRNSSGL